MTKEGPLDSNNFGLHASARNCKRQHQNLIQNLQKRRARSPGHPAMNPIDPIPRISTFHELSNNSASLSKKSHGQYSLNWTLGLYYVLCRELWNKAMIPVSPRQFLTDFGGRGWSRYPLLRLNRGHSSISYTAFWPIQTVCHLIAIILFHNRWIRRSCVPIAFFQGELLKV